MDLVKLAETLVKSLANNPDAVSVKEFETDEDGVTLIQIMVEEADMGAIIGKGGKTANAIRTLVQASSYINNGKKVKINIDSF